MYNTMHVYIWYLYAYYIIHICVYCINSVVEVCILRYVYTCVWVAVRGQHWVSSWITLPNAFLRWSVSLS